MKTLVLWSGGVESTSLLLRLLTETQDPVHAHFIEMDNREKRFTLERNAVHTLLPMLRAIRDFEFTDSHISVADGQASGYDYLLQYPIALYVAKWKACTCIYRAGCLEDEWETVSDLAGNVRFTRPNEAMGAAHNRRAMVYQAIEPHIQLSPYLPSYQLPKARHMQYLGPLAEFTWSCRRPVNDGKCDRCHACLHRAAALKNTSIIPEVAARLAAGEFQ